MDSRIQLTFYILVTIITTTAPAVSVVTTTAVPFTTGACTGPANYSSPTCTQYYSCVYVMWWWDHKLLDCPTGEGFDGTAGNCTASATCLITTLPTSTSTSATPVVTTSTTLAPITTVPSAASTTTVTTPTSVVSTSTSAPTTSVSTTTGTTPTSLVSTSTSAPTTPAVLTTPAVVTGPPACSGPSKSPGPQPNQYYECIPYLWWFQPQLNTCPDGQIFDAQTLACVASSVN